MENTTKVTAEQVRLMAEAVDLHLPPEALEKLAVDYSKFIAGFAKVRQIDTGDREPPVLVPAPAVGR